MDLLTVRGERLDRKGHSVHGHYFKSGLTAEFNVAPEHGAFFGTDRKRHCIADENGVVFEVDPATIERWTGKYDRHGMAIYQGDRIRHGETVWEVSFGDACFWISNEDSTMEFHTILGDNAIELISNNDTPVKPNGTLWMDFGQAIEALKNGQKVAREGWNGKGMFLFLLPAGTIPKAAIHDPKLREVLEGNGKDSFEALASIRMMTADGKILTGWLASQTDMLAEDWVIVE